MSISATTLRKEIEKFTDFTCGPYSIKIPYYLGGKNTAEKIEENLVDLCGGTVEGVNQSKMQQLANNNKSLCGVDCSGFVFTVLDRASSGELKKVHTGGILNTNARTLTEHGKSTPSNGYLAKRAADIVPGTMICTDAGGHILIVYDVIKSAGGVVTEIRYAHSNGSMGPHKGYIKIGNQSNELDSSSQTWVDDAYTDSEAKRLYCHSYNIKFL